MLNYKIKNSKCILHENAQFCTELLPDFKPIGQVGISSHDIIKMNDYFMGPQMLYTKGTVYYPSGFR